MNTDAFDQLTATYARQDAADTFLVHALARGSLGDLVRDPDVLSVFFKNRKTLHKSLYPLVTKAAIAAMDLSSGLAASSPDARAFLEQVNRVSPLGQINPIAVRGNITAAVQTGNASATWVGEQTSKPITALTFSAAALRPLKLIAQIVVSEELADLSVPDALGIVRRALISAAAAAEATTLLDSTIAAIANTRPGSIINGVTPIVAAGDFAANISQVLNALSGGEPVRPVLVVSFGTAVRMQAMLRDLRELGVKVVISSVAGGKIIGVDADGLLVTEGGIDIRVGTPDVQMNDSPDSPPTASTVLTATWQRNLRVLKVERWVNWTVRSGAVATLTLA